MRKKRYTPEEIVVKLRQVDVLVSQSQNIADAFRQIGVSEVTYYWWRQEYGGLKTEQVKRLKELETDNTRLRKAVSDLTLDKLILQEVARETSKPRAPPRLYRAVQAVMHVSERRACAALGQRRSTQRKVPRGRDDEERLTAGTIAGPAIRPLRLSQDCRVAGAVRLDRQRQAS
jgi:putative transposase